MKINEVTSLSLPMPIISFKELYHVGNMEKSKKRNNSFEGTGLSVSLNPDAWRKITKGRTTGNLHILTKDNNKFIDAHKLSTKHKKEIIQYGIENGLIEKIQAYKVSYYDEELEGEIEEFFDTYQEAQYEYDDENIQKTTTYKPTNKLKSLTNTTHNSFNFDILLTVYADNETDVDGIWWNDKSTQYTEPRAVIFNDKLNTFGIETK